MSAIIAEIPCPTCLKPQVVDGADLDVLHLIVDGACVDCGTRFSARVEWTLRLTGAVAMPLSKEQGAGR